MRVNSDFLNGALAEQSTIPMALKQMPAKLSSPYCMKLKDKAFYKITARE
jgi:hypothetical protein